MINILSYIKDAISDTIGKIYWKPSERKVLNDSELDVVRQKLKDNYFIIATRHPGNLSSYAIAFAHFVLTGRRGYYAHVLMNMENIVNTDADFRFIEATGEGVHYSGWSEVFDPRIGSVALLKPKALSLDEWTKVLDNARTHLGKPYDTLFDLSNENALSCVELIRSALKAEPNYATDFANFERMITKSRNLTPQMFYECEDFEVVYEVRR